MEVGTLLEPPALLTVGAVLAAGLAAVYFGVRHSERAVRAAGAATGQGVAAGLAPADDEEEWGVDEPPLPEKREFRPFDDASEAGEVADATPARDEEVTPGDEGEAGEGEASEPSISEILARYWSRRRGRRDA